MNKTELVEAVVAKAGISKKDADAAVKATFGCNKFQVCIVQNSIAKWYNVFEEMYPL